MGKPNVLLITVDCLRRDHLGCYGYSRDTTPNLDRLAAKGALFLEAIANGGRTPDSFPSILASQLPPLVRDEYREIMKRGPTLAGLMRGAGYQTAAFHSNPFLSKFFYYDNGFDVYEDSLGTLNIRRQWATSGTRRLKILSKIKSRLGIIFNFVLYLFGKQREATAEQLTNRVVSWLDTCSESFFLWSHYMDAHYPFLPPVEYVRKVCKRRISRYRMATLHYKQLRSFRNVDIRKAEWLSSAEIDTLADLYDADIRYADDNIGRLLKSLGSRLKNTIVIVTADHGEAFGEHKYLGHGTLYEELVRVPLIMVGPGIKAGTVVKTPVELMDLPPTVVELAGTSRAKGFRGRSLLPVMRGTKRATEGTVATRLIPELRQRLISYRTPNWKYIRTESLDESNTVLSEELYDLENDPGERRNLHGSGDGKARAFKSEAVKKIKEFKRLKSEEKTAYEKGRIKARLKKLPRL
jgi:arylsulfatase A-like enzyme